MTSDSPETLDRALVLLTGLLQAIALTQPTKRPPSGWTAAFISRIRDLLDQSSAAPPQPFSGSSRLASLSPQIQIELVRATAETFLRYVNDESVSDTSATLTHRRDRWAHLTQASRALLDTAVPFQAPLVFPTAALTQSVRAYSRAVWDSWRVYLWTQGLRASSVQQVLGAFSEIRR